jgi:hypothetical protein
LLPTTIYQSTSSNNASVYSLINSATANTFNLNNVSLVGNLSSNYVFGNSTETVLTDGSNLYGNGNSTITFNYLSGIYASSPIYYNGSTSDNWNSVYSLINTTSATTFNVSSLSATSNINVNGNLALNNFNSKLYFAGNYLQGNGNAIIVGAYGMGFRAQGGLANSFLLATDGVIGFGNDVSYWYTNNQRVGLTYDGPATFAQKDFNNSQTYRLYNTYTDVNNYERGAITFSKPTSAFTLSVESAGTGVNRDFWINTAGTPKLVVTSGGNVGIGTINPNQTLSVFGNISSSGLIYDQIGNSNQWNTAYSLVSGGIVSTLNLPQSASWISTTSTVSSLSGGWQTAYQSVSTTNALSLSSSYWNTAYSIVSGGIVAPSPTLFPYTSGTSINNIKPVNGSNTSSANYSNVAGGYGNTASGYSSNVGGGFHNFASNYYSNVAGGQSNNASKNFSNVAGGQSNTASGYFSNVAGGRNNTASGNSSNVAGGTGNTASGNYSNVAGGIGNTASGNYSSILGGNNNNTNNQACSFIVGQGIIASQPNFTYVNNLSSQGSISSPSISAIKFYGDGSNLTGVSTYTGSDLKSLSGNWQSTYNTVSSLSGNWKTAYTWTQNNSAIATFSTSVSTNYVYCTSLSSTYVYGNSSETTLTDGANLTGNGAGTLTLNYSNGVYIASNTVPTVDNSYNFGSGTNRWKAIYAANGTIQTSDGREKTNITPSPLGLDFINILNPVSYNFIVGGNEVVKDENGNITSIVPVSGKRTHFGLIAQEVQKAVPQGIDFGGWIITDLNDPDSRQGLRYEEFISPLIKSIQELSTTVNNLTIKNQQLWSIVSSLTSK